MVPNVSRSSDQNHFGGEARLLSHHLSGYLTCKILAGFCSLPPLDPERVRVLSIDHNYDALLQGQTGVKATLARNFLLPLLTNHLSPLIEARLLEIGETAQTKADFPAKLFNAAIERTVAYYKNVEQAARQVASEPFPTTTVDKSIEGALEQLSEKNGLSEQVLLTLSSQKLMEEVVNRSILERTPALLYWPVALLLKPIGWTVQFAVGPLVNFAKGQLSEDPSPPDKLLDRLAIPANIATCRFLHQLKKRLQDEGRRHYTSRPLKIDHELLKDYWKKELLILQIGECSSREQLAQVFKGSTFQKGLDWIQDTYALEETIKVIEEIIASAWQIAKDPAWRKRELLLLYRAMNDTFRSPQRLIGQADDVEHALDELIGVILKNKFDTMFRKNDKLTDLSGYFRRFSGINIKKTAVNLITPLACSAQKEASEQFTRFWSKSYSLRFGIVHHQLLRPWLNK